MRCSSQKKIFRKGHIDKRTWFKSPSRIESEKTGVGYADMKKAKAGDAMEMICPNCLPRSPSASLANPWRKLSTIADGEHVLALHIGQ